MQMLKLIPQHVRLGEPLLWSVRDAEGHLLLARGHLITDAGQMAALLERGAFVDVEEVKNSVAAGAPKRTDPDKQRSNTVFELWERALWQLDRLLRGAHETPDFAGKVEELALHLHTLIDRDTDIAIYLTVRQDPKRLSIYGLAHSVHCALIAVLMGRRLGWDESQVLCLTKAALTMNIAMLDLQGRLATQGVPPTPAQQQGIFEHPDKGVEMLRAAGVTDEAWLTAVAQHHEKPDGSGYPRKLKELSTLGNALRHLDIFIAKISPRAGRDPLSIQEAERQLLQEDNGGPIAMAIIKEFGIYPPGDLVLLKSGEHAVVVRRTADARKPLVASITNRSGVPVTTTTHRDSSRPDFAIVSVVSDKALVARLLPERLYGLGE